MDTAANLNKKGDNSKGEETRVSMSVNYNNPDCQKEDNESDINPNDFANIQPIVKVGYIYPNLYSQASYLKKDMKNLNNQLLKAIEKFTSLERYGSVERILDALYNHIMQEIETAKDREEITPGDIKDIANETYAYNQLAKGLLNILHITDMITEKKKCIEFTKKRVLL